MKFLFVAMLFLLASPSHAMTCKNDYAGLDGCAANSTAAGDCETLGFTNLETRGCTHYLYCPFDNNYKRCVSIPSVDIACPSTYTDQAITISYCSSSKTERTIGWVIDSFTLNALTCSKCRCEAKDCIWNASNAGKSLLKFKCCNGYYKTCTNTCADTFTGSIPNHATGVYEKCFGCGQTKSILIGFSCDSGYTKIDNSCHKCGSFYCGPSYDQCVYRCDDTYSQGCGVAGGWECEALNQCREDCYSSECSKITCP